MEARIIMVVLAVVLLTLKTARGRKPRNIDGGYDE